MSSSSSAGMSWGTFVVILLLGGTYVAQLTFTQTQLRKESAQIEQQFEQQESQKVQQLLVELLLQEVWL